MRISWTAFLDGGDDVFRDEQTSMQWSSNEQEYGDDLQIDSVAAKVHDLRQKCTHGLGGSSIRVLAAGALADVSKYSTLVE